MITCKLCGKEFGSITPTHLKTKHNITVAEYREKFPDAPLRSPEACLGTSQGLKGKPKSPEHVANVTKANRRKAKDPDWLAKVRANNAARRKPKPPRTLCLCGCGQLANHGCKWVSGHNGRGINGYDPNKQTPKPKLCACGCGGMTKGSEFKPGHRQYGKDSYKDRQATKKARFSKQLCACGCQQFLTIKEVARGFNHKHGHKPKIEPHLCECGCGELTTAPRFKHGHWARTKQGRRTVSQTISSYYSDPTKHHNWHGGKSYIDYPREFNDGLREQIRKRDNYICQICDRRQKRGEIGFDIHHWTYDKKDLDHLITLCHTCHTKTNYNRNLWVLYFFLKFWVGRAS